MVWINLLVSYALIAVAASAFSVDFGGYFVWNIATGQCQQPNALTESCSCLSQTVPDIGFLHPGPVETATVLCYGSIPGGFHGAYMQLKLPNGSVACETPNKFIGDCSCSSSSKWHQDYTPFPSHKNHTVTVCYGPEPSLFFGGVSVTSYLANGSAFCQENPFAPNNGVCSVCPANYSTMSIFSAHATLCGFSCWLSESSATCSLVQSCSWCGNSSSTGSCYPTAAAGRGWCCDDGAVSPCPTPAPPYCVECPCGMCCGWGSFCCANWDADGTSFCCDPSMCPQNTTASCGPADYEGPCMCESTH
jgi:hypothetical protein